MKVLGVEWFTEMGCEPIGIVLVEFNKQEMQDYDRKTPVNAFIGTSVAGQDEKKDIEKIVERGARFPVKAAKLLIRAKR